MLGIVGAFVYLFLASLALGMAFGLGIAFLLKLLRSRDSPQVRPALRVQKCTPRGSVMLPEPSTSPQIASKSPTSSWVRLQVTRYPDVLLARCTGSFVKP